MTQFTSPIISRPKVVTPTISPTRKKRSSRPDRCRQRRPAPGAGQMPGIPSLEPPAASQSHLSENWLAGSSLVYGWLKFSVCGCEPAGQQQWERSPWFPVQDEDAGLLRACREGKPGDGTAPEPTLSPSCHMHCSAGLLKRGR